MSILDTLLPKEERQVVRSDSMDTRMFTELREQSGNLQKVEKEGTESLKTFPPLTQDIWSSLFKFSPEFRKSEEIAPSHRFNATLVDKMTQMQQYRELRVHTRLDEMHSALATVALAGEMAKTLKEELKEQVTTIAPRSATTAYSRRIAASSVPDPATWLSFAVS